MNPEFDKKTQHFDPNLVLNLPPFLDSDLDPLIEGGVSGQSLEFPVENESTPGREKTSLRMIYEAQVQVIRRQIGGLEKVRKDLGLSQRKIAQLLLVDPSAWTRWTRSPEESAPPHIWRALQWYLALQEKIPGLNHQYFQSVQSPIQREVSHQKIQAQEGRIRNLELSWRERESASQNRILELQKLVENLQKTQVFYRKTLLFLGVGVLFLALLGGIIAYFASISMHLAK